MGIVSLGLARGALSEIAAVGEACQRMVADPMGPIPRSDLNITVMGFQVKTPRPLK